LELVGHPKQRAKDGGAIIAGQIDESSFNDEAAESMSCRVRSRRSTCHVRMSCRARAA
jgi:hypothetical protein